MQRTPARPQLEQIISGLNPQIVHLPISEDVNHANNNAAVVSTKIVLQTAILNSFGARGGTLIAAAIARKGDSTP